ncbi:MAG: hypothetical protein M1838_001145 [Thelocarpon superellum]|nr:MAG: hypothetical protein M1838_001145 [Thelocarpon superellum]
MRFSRSLGLSLPLLCAVGTAVGNPTPATNSTTSLVTRQGAPYVQGTCHLHLWQTLGGRLGSIDGPMNFAIFAVEVKMYDNDLNQIGCMQTAPCDATHTCQAESRLEDYLLMTPEEEGDYIQFKLGAQSWTSSNIGAPTAHCTVGAWDDSEDGNWPNRQMDCTYECFYGGGESTGGADCGDPTCDVVGAWGCG